MIFGLFLFTNGFFLSGSVRTDQSNCPLTQNYLKRLGDPFFAAMECLKPCARVILLIVVALKYEFLSKLHDAGPKLLKLIADPY